MVRKGQNYHIGSDIFMNVLELQVNRSQGREDKAQYAEMIKFFARECQSGTKI